MYSKTWFITDTYIILQCNSSTEIVVNLEQACNEKCLKLGCKSAGIDHFKTLEIFSKKYSS